MSLLSITMNRKCKSGISPVVATVILVAVAIIIAIAVAFWASGLVGVFTRYEKLEVTSAYYDTAQDAVVLTIRNTGSADTTIDDIYVNGIPGADNNCSDQTIAVGDTINCNVDAPPQAVTGGGWVSGVTYEIAVHTASGKLYPVSVLIP